MKNNLFLTVGMDFVYSMLKNDVKVVYLTESFHLHLIKEGEISFHNLKTIPFPNSESCVFKLYPGYAYEFPF